MNVKIYILLLVASDYPLTFVNEKNWKHWLNVLFVNAVAAVRNGKEVLLQVTNYVIIFYF